MFKYIILSLISISLMGCPEEDKGIDTNNEFVDDTGSEGIDTDGLPAGTECNQSGICTYECTGGECGDGVDIAGGMMISASCCHYDSGENLVCDSTGWYERQSDGFIVADCDDDEICRLTFQININ